jgi:hypothetical protein
MEERANENEPGLRIIGAFFPAVVTAHLLSVWLPKPLAWAGSVIGWLIFFYWFPSRAGMSLRRWLVIASVLTLLVLIAATFQPDML